MATEYSITAADLRNIERNLGAIHQSVDVLKGDVRQIDQNVMAVSNNLNKLTSDFNNYVQKAERQHNLSVAEIRLGNVRQELETKYGHYGEVRRTTIGILQADDLAIVRRETITTTTEKLMLSTPNYWLAPCLVALAAWIADKPQVAERALHEAIHRNDEKSSLLLALICRRAGRKSVCLKWTQRYLAGQDEENLDRKCVIILDAYASGLLGVDSEGVVARQMLIWLERLAEKPGFVEQQTQQWSQAIQSQCPQLDDGSYPYLQQYSATWPVLKEILEGAGLHAKIYAYFDGIFSQETDAGPLKQQLDEIMTSLVTDFDDEELPLRREEKLNQFIVNFDGDLSRAQTKMQMEQSAFETHKDFTQLLTDAAMNPESAHASISTQKFAIALSKQWILNAYNDVTARNRMKIPHEISVDVDTFHGTTVDGENEEQMLADFNSLVDREKQEVLSQIKMSGLTKFGLYGGPALAVLGLLASLSGASLGIVLVIIGIWMLINYFIQKSKTKSYREQRESQFEQKREDGQKAIRAVMAEVVDFRNEFAQLDGESRLVTDFLEQIAPEQYVRKMADSGRKLKV